MTGRPARLDEFSPVLQERPDGGELGVDRCQRLLKNGVAVRREDLSRSEGELGLRGPGGGSGGGHVREGRGLKEFC